MKNLLLLTLLMTLFIASHAQDNKPEANSFGMQYGVNFNGTVNQSVQLSGWIKHGIEIRGALTFSYLNSKTDNIYSNSTVYINNRELPSVNTQTSSSENLSIAPSISVVKHFPIKGNLDFFVGASVNAGFSAPTAWSTNISTTTADSFYSYRSNSSKVPLAFNWGASIIGGANFFFYKNLAIGADFGVGFGASNSKGTYQGHDIAINNGLNNQSTANYDHITNYTVNNSRYLVNLTGNAGLHLTYYVPCKKKNSKISDPKI